MASPGRAAPPPAVPALAAPRLAAPAALAALLLLLLAAPAARGHEGDLFSVVVRADGPAPETARIFVNDTVKWINVDDNEENVTHRIRYDGDGDGRYDGPNEWDSGVLNATCERDANGTRKDPNCRESFAVTFNASFAPGPYNYTDTLSNGTLFNATVLLLAHHGDLDGSPGTGGAAPPASAGGGGPLWLLAVAAVAAAGAVGLGGFAFARRGSGPTGSTPARPARGEDEAEMGAADAGAGGSPAEGEPSAADGPQGDAPGAREGGAG